MKDLRRVIRKLILESFASDFKTLSDDPGYRSAQAYFSSGAGYPQTHYRPWSRSVGYRRNIKQLFQTYADNEELNDHIGCIHYFNYVPASRTAEIPEQLEKFVNRHDPNTIQKNEISTVGYYYPSDRTPQGCGIILDKKYITFAFKGDAWTEETKTAFRNPQSREPFLLINTETGKIVGAHLSKPIDFEDTNWEQISDVDEGVRSLFFRDPLDRMENETMDEFLDRVKAEYDRSGIEAISREIPNKYRKRTNMEVHLKDLAKRNPKYKIVTFPEYYENSGIPKRPSMNIDASKVVLNMDDFRDKQGNLIKNDQFSYLYEVVCDNWSYNTVYIHPDWIITPKMNKIIKQNNLKLVRSLP